MKLYHFVGIFAIIALTIILVLDVKTNQLKAVISNVKQIDQNLDTAIDDGVTKLVQVNQNNKIIVNKEAAINSFFLSLNATFGTLSDRGLREKLNLYIPVITVTLEDGYYIFYSDEYIGEDGKTYVSKRWSEKFPYYYEDDNFIYRFTLGDVITIYDKKGRLSLIGDQSTFQLDYHDLQTKEEYASFRGSFPESFLLSEEAFQAIRKSTIRNRLEQSMAYYTSAHNKIASNYGITYNFCFPSVREEEWDDYLDDISMFVVFQGYPYGNGAGEVYQRFVSAGAKVSKSNTYYIEQKDWYYIYHKSTCPKLKEGGIIINDEPYYNIEDCVKEGCYSCPVCGNGTGVLAPDYNP